MDILASLQCQAPLQCQNVEIARAGDSDIGRDALSDTGLSLSPGVGLCLEPDINATASQLASHSPAALNVQSTDATSDLSTATLLNVSQISLPAMDTADQLSHPAASGIVPQVTETEESIKRNEPSLEDYNYNWGYVCNLPYAVESHLFREHLASRYLEDKRKISWAQVHCNDCRMNVNKLSVRTKKTNDIYAPRLIAWHRLVLLAITGSLSSCFFYIYLDGFKLYCLLKVHRDVY